MDVKEKVEKAEKADKKAASSSTKSEKGKKKNKKEEMDEKITPDLSPDFGIQIYYIALSILVIYVIRCIILHR